MTSGRDFRCWHICDGRERVETRLPTTGPVIPKSCDEHVFRWLRIKLQNEVLLLLLTWSQFAVLVKKLRYVFVESTNEHDRVFAAVDPASIRQANLCERCMFLRIACRSPTFFRRGGMYNALAG